MNKTKLKDFAVNARNILKEQIDFKIKWLDPLGEYETQKIADKILLVNDKRNIELSVEENKSRLALRSRIKSLGYEQTIEEVAFTWFNRLIAIRYMEVNEFLPLGKNNETVDVRILSNRKDGTYDPEIIEYANLYSKFIDLDLDYNEIEKTNGNYQEVYSYVLIKICKKLGKVIPMIFDGVTDYIDILIPNNLLAENSIIRQLTDLEMISEEEWKEQVEIIGWLYQYYISEKKDEVFADLKNNIKITKNNIPAATQLFTPDWIVKYMVENSLGKLWLEINDNKELKNKWKYCTEQDIVPMKKTVKPIEISIIDPCMGSGHILVYAFRVLYDIYKSMGYLNTDIPRLILENNIYGIDIDSRASQLAYFALIMEARRYDKDILKKLPNVNVIGIEESNDIELKTLDLLKDKDTIEIIEYIMEIFKDAKEYGSILKVKKMNYEIVLEKINELNKKELNIFELEELKEINDKFKPLVEQAIILSNTYDCVITNPPYMGSSGMDTKLKKYVEKEYKKGKSDFFAVFMEKAMELAKKDRYVSMITMHSWMFLSSYKDLREYLLNNFTITDMMHLGIGSFDEMNGYHVLATSFVLKKSKFDNYCGNYIRLVDYYNHNDKKTEFYNKLNYYKFNQDNYLDIPNSIIVYWLNDKMIDIFKNSKKLSDYADTKQGMATGDNKRFLRFWFEVDRNKIGLNMHSIEDAHNSGKKWFPYHKNGNYRKWYGNNEVVVAFDKENYNILANMGNHLPSRQFYFQKGITWSLFGWEAFSVRYKDYGYVFDVSGSSAFMKEELIYYVLAFLTSNVAFYFLSILAPTVNFQIGNIADLPLIITENTEKRSEIEELAKENIEIAKEDWDSFENSWDYEMHPLIKYKGTTIKDSYNNWKEKCNENFIKMKKNEERINYLFNQIYNITDEIDEKVKDKWITAYVPSEKEEIKSFISYAVGCMLGRYSLDKKGIAFAGGKFNANDYTTFQADNDGIIPLTDEEYFEDDIISRFCDFLSVLYGKEYLDENLEFIANAIGKKGAETSKECLRNYFLNDFYIEHCKKYQKSPIYWLFDSGKDNGFKALIYVHRYQRDMIAKIRMDYLHKLQKKYETLIDSIDIRMSEITSVADEKKQQKRKQKYTKQLNETRKYDEKIKHIADKNIEIDLDDGVIINYAKFKDILAKIK